MQPVKIYLDQKDFSVIGKGLAGESRYAEELKIYELLIDMVNNNKIRIFFSSLHAIEALRYKEESIELVKPYCQVVDALTQGHCIKYIDKLVKLEFEIFLCNFYGIYTISSEYAYGKNIEAFSFSDNLFLNFGKGLKNSIRDKISQNPDLSSKQKKIANKKIDNKRVFREFLTYNFPSYLLEKVQEQYPGFKLSKDEFIEILIGNAVVEAKALKRCWADIVKFENLILYYSKTHPELKKMGSSFDETSNILITQIISLQNLRNQFPDLELGKGKENNLLQETMVKIINDKDKLIMNICRKHGFDFNEAKQLLVERGPDEINSINAYKTFAIEYLKAHRGNRNPMQSDLRDILHLINLPYVDIYSTDKFFTEVARRKTIQYGTRVVNNLQQLKAILVDEFNPSAQNLN